MHARIRIKITIKIRNQKHRPKNRDAPYPPRILAKTVRDGQDG
jgi:hypothetical protein